MDWIELAQGRDNCVVLVKTAIKFNRFENKT